MIETTSSETPLLQKRSLASSLYVFGALQLLDVLTTLVGLHFGSNEASPFVRVLIAATNPLAGLLLCKFAAASLLVLMLACRPQAIAKVNLVFGALGLWNIMQIVKLF